MSTACNPDGENLREYGRDGMSDEQQAKVGQQQAIEITLRQAEELVKFFGGHDLEATVMQRPAAWHDMPDGLYAYCTEYPEEGSHWLGATEVDDDLAMNGRPMPTAAHPDDLAVDRFAAAMKAKMAASRAKGRGGWGDPEQCPVERLQTMLVDHLAKGDPVDVGNFAMMLFNREAQVTADMTLRCSYIARDASGRLTHVTVINGDELQRLEPIAAPIAAQAETDRLLSSPANAAHLARSIEQARNGQAQERRLVEVEESSAPSAAPATIAVPVDAYLWLMGLGNDGFVEDRRGAFWWRDAFNERAGLDMISIYAAAKFPHGAAVPPLQISPSSDAGAVTAPQKGGA